jgi:hypothetical protein
MRRTGAGRQRRTCRDIEDRTRCSSRHHAFPAPLTTPFYRVCRVRNLGASGEGEGNDKRWDRASSISPTTPRAPRMPIRTATSFHWHNALSDANLRAASNAKNGPFHPPCRHFAPLPLAPCCGITSCGSYEQSRAARDLDPRSRPGFPDELAAQQPSCRTRRKSSAARSTRALHQVFVMRAADRHFNFFLPRHWQIVWRVAAREYNSGSARFEFSAPLARSDCLR